MAIILLANRCIFQMIPVLNDRISKSDRFNRALNREYGVLIIGVPNVGKSSLINSIRSNFLKKCKFSFVIFARNSELPFVIRCVYAAGVARVGAVAGITRAVQTRIKVSNSPPVFVYDTPGILTPNIPNMEVGMKLALCCKYFMLDLLVGY